MWVELHDFPEYREIPMVTMQDNPNGDLPVYIRKYHPDGMTRGVHRHRFIQINYILSGRVGHRINHSEFEVCKGDVFVIPPYIPHSLNALRDVGFEIVELEFEPDFVWGGGDIRKDVGAFWDFAYIEPFLVCEGEVKPGLHLNESDQAAAQQLLDEIYREYQGQDDGYLLAIKANLLKLLVFLGRRFRRDISNTEAETIFQCHREAMEHAMAYIDNCFTEDLRVEDAAKTAMLSRSYFCYLFKLMTGKTFVEYLNMLRVSQAKKMLGETLAPITEVCFKSGFHSISHFNRVFKAVVGISPRQYRAAWNGKRK